MSTKNINNKIVLPENTIVFEKSGVKIITGVDPALAEMDMINDTVVNPGDTVITTEGKQLVKNPDGSYTDLSTAGGGGSPVDLTPFLRRDGTATVTGVLTPSVDNTYNLGASNRRFSFGYFFRLLTDRIQDPSSLITVNMQSATLTNAVGEDMFSWSGANLSAKNNRIEETADPIQPQDAATKNYVDTNSQIPRVEQTVSGALTPGPQVFDQLFDFNEAQYTSVNGILEILISDSTNVVQLYDVYSVYDSLTTGVWHSTMNVVSSNGQNLPAGVSFNINSLGQLEYQISVTPVSAITAKFRAQVL